MSRVDREDGTILMDTDTMRTQQRAFGLLDTFTENAGHCAALHVIADNTGILVIGDDDVVILIDREMFGGVEFCLQSLASSVAGLARSCNRLDPAVRCHPSQGVTTAFQNVQIVL